MRSVENGQARSQDLSSYRLGGKMTDPGNEVGKWGVWQMRSVESAVCGKCGKCRGFNDNINNKKHFISFKKRSCIIAFSLQNRTLFFQAIQNGEQNGKQEKNETSETLLPITTSSLCSLKKR